MTWHSAGVQLLEAHFSIDMLLRWSKESDFSPALFSGLEPCLDGALGAIPHASGVICL